MFTKAEATQAANQFLKTWPQRFGDMIESNARSGTVGGAMSLTGVTAPVRASLVANLTILGWTVVDDGVLITVS